MRRALLAVLVLAACGRDKKPTEGLPATAQEWSQNAQGQMVQQGQLDPKALPPPAPPPGMMNPHGGGGGGHANDPHAGLGIDPTDPHAGLGIAPVGGGGGMGVADPHGAGGPDVTQLGLPVPDPNRKIDPTRFVKGSIKIHEKARTRAKAGTPLFLVVKRAGSDGSPTGQPLAVEKLDWNAAGELAFALTEAQAMVGGTELVGEVIVSARYDQDGDALSKQPGDITGSTRVTLPAENVTIVLDTIL
ncbi:MAG: hypothetical protein ACKV2T_35990 [Kofleriaceae bacterium]